MTPQFSKEDRKIVTDFIARFNKIFSVNKVSDAHNYHHSEIYVWNKFTINVCSIDKFSTLAGFTVEIYFDSERLDYKNKTVKFGKDEESMNAALALCKQLYKENSGDLLVDALSDSD
jgi:hypothetical protein